MANEHFVIPVPGGWQAFRAYRDKVGDLSYEWLTERGWRRVRGGSCNGRKPKDVVTFRVSEPQEGKG